ncbi:hypothetical protein CYMTET_16004 [Cymbomonas tetramitiformis]|uniref:Uncharacterized protein n=1 Tax=Cymbomonas tetramitiformis TaxID=36881 RepID=A0AAE0GCV2_9CHLO|nr:hypothetical protein CYMTET_16004 [Cymbomonas tetramitiformis]
MVEIGAPARGGSRPQCSRKEQSRGHSERQVRAPAGMSRELKAPSKVPELEMGAAPPASVLAREPGSRGRTMRQKRSPGVQLATVLA